MFQYLHSHVSCPTYNNWLRSQGNNFFQDFVNNFILIDGIEICHDLDQSKSKNGRKCVVEDEILFEHQKHDISFFLYDV